MVDWEALYRRLPVGLQQAACSMEGWRIRRSRYGRAFFGALAAAESRTYWSAERLVDLRDRQLAEFVRYCAATVPYYRRKFRQWGVVPEEIRRLEDLHRMPLLTKDEIREYLAELVSEAVPRSARTTVHTSGTTGSGLRFPSTAQALCEQWATWWRYRRWHGIGLDTWCGYFGGRIVVPFAQRRPPFWRYNVAMRQILFSGHHISDTTLPSYLDELRRSRPPWLSGYPSLIALLASYMLDTGADLGYRVRWITTSSETLSPGRAELIARAFGVRPLQHYGLTEGAANFSECERGNLHVDEDFAAVEFVPDDASPGGAWVVGTNFTNPATPLLRYAIQDRVALPHTGCGCGRSGRVVGNVDGRREDYVVLKSGEVLGRMDPAFKDLVRIREAQIYQRAPGMITVRLVRAQDYSMRDEHALLRELRQRLGGDTEITIDYVDRLERSKNGKLRFVVSALDEPHSERAPESDTCQNPYPTK